MHSKLNSPGAHLRRVDLHYKNNKKYSIIKQLSIE